MPNKDSLMKFIMSQLSVWRLAAENLHNLKRAKTKVLEVSGLKVTIQNNPARIISSSSKMDSDTLNKRKCFLCSVNRPSEQRSIKFEGRKGRKYDILVNPYPIFPNHLVIAGENHIEQSIAHKYVDMMDFAHHYRDFVIFYNGPKCGASAPDHLHFQACPKGIIPLENDVNRILDTIAFDLPVVPNSEEKVNIPEVLQDEIEYITSVQEAQAYHYKKFTRGIFVLRARTSKSLAKLFYRLLDAAPVKEEEKEPRINLLTWYSHLPGAAFENERPAGNTHGLSSFEYRAILIFRNEHRSHHYSADDEEHIMISPGCADMGGLFIVPDKEDYQKVNSEIIKEILSEVSVSEDVEENVIWKLKRSQPKIEVGIMAAEKIIFEIISDGAGPQCVYYRDGKIDYNGTLYDELFFDARTMSTMFAEPTFILQDVTIGIDFHWQRQITQKFAGALKFIVEGEKVRAVNIIGVEDYLLSVISSEMKSSATLEYLKAHAVISRSWAMTQIRNKSKEKKDQNTGNAHIRWFDHEDHKNFDVCADDHCQRYQGLSIAVGENVRKAIDSTWGEFLMYDGKICDTRFSKCCGGITETFDTCWEDKDYPYLKSFPDTPDYDPNGKAFCNTHNKEILSQVLNDYDLETEDFYRWEVKYGREKISELISNRSGEDIGLLNELKPVEYGGSGRIKLLKIVGTKRSLLVGKELMIRRYLSDSHLKSSAFSISYYEDNGREVSAGEDFDYLILKGKGWGHGVGFCQIGAAVMAYDGYSYDEILAHYYPGAELVKDV